MAGLKGKLKRGPNISLQERILLLAPTGGDSANTINVLRTAGFEGVICRDLGEVVELANEGVGAMVVAEESLTAGTLDILTKYLQAQPSWSDVPLVVITTGGDTTQFSMRAYQAFGPAANLSLVERPFRVITLLSTLRTALRSRRRQYEVRDLLEQLEDKVSERTAKLEATISELEAFSYSMSHDLRAPLRAMRGYSEVVLQEHSSKMDETGKDYLKRILTAAERLDRLVQDVLRYSRCARESIECVPVDVDRVITAVIAEYPPFRSPHSEVTLVRPLLCVRGHEASLTQVISNLLANAVKFVREAEIPKVKIWTELVDGRVRIFFADNGIGIAQENHTKIFKMFERLSASAQYEGTGIGLAIVSKAVERMGGAVGVQSVLGRGSTFWVELAACP